MLAISVHIAKSWIMTITLPVNVLRSIMMSALSVESTSDWRNKTEWIMKFETVE